MIQLTLTLKMTTAQIVKMSVTVNNSPIQDHTHENHDSWVQTFYRFKKCYCRFINLSVLLKWRRVGLCLYCQDSSVTLMVYCCFVP